MPTLFTAGHSTREVEELIEMLQEPGVQTLIDVRRFPGSRRHPQFSRDALSASLAAAGIEYVHAADLGGRREPRPDSPNTAWRVAAFRGYADYMDQPAFRAALAHLLLRAAAAPTAILCAEAVPWRCHRRLIADAAVVQGFGVIHLLAPGRAESHALNPLARRVPTDSDGWRLIYDGDPTAKAPPAPTLPFLTPAEPPTPDP